MTTAPKPGPLLLITGGLFILLGLALAAGGGYLLTLGGSLYYLVAGLGFAIIGGLVLKGRRLALGLFALFLIVSVIWAVLEVRFDWWQLLPRLDIWFVAAIWLLLPFVNRRLRHADGSAGTSDTGRTALMASAVVTLLVGAFALTQDYHDLHGEVPNENMAATTPPDVAGVAPKDWTAYGHSGLGDRYAPATQITPANAGQLQPAWSFHTGDFKGPTDPGEIANEVTPIKVNGMLYMCTPHNIVIALNPDTGKEIWRYDPKINRDASSYQHMICRGVSYWDVNAPSLASTPPASPPADAPNPATMECPRRIFAPTMDATLIAVNADTGVPCKTFGENGVVGLYHGMAMKKRGFLMPTSPPVVSQHMLVMAASVTDNDSTDEPSGVIRGYDPVTGKLVWNWDAARPDDTNPIGNGQTYVNNSPNSWGVSSVDEKLGMVYIPMGNETPDLWGGHRNKNGERFNSAIVALDLATGKLHWVYQTVHHDIWDMDIGGQPTLVDIDTPKGKVPSVVATTKRGDIYVIDRRDGTLVVPAPEKPVPQGAAAGDHVSPTQPFSALTFLPERNISEADMWGTTPFDQLACRITFKERRYEGPFTPQTAGKGAIISPGPLGIFEWGGATVDPVRQLLIVNPDYMGFLERLVPRAQATVNGGSGTEMGLQPMTGTPFAVEIKAFLSPLGFPCQAPPWGYVAAVDLKTMKKVWMHKNGTTMDSAPVPIPLPLGVPSLGGMSTTGGGVAFLSSALDYYIRGYDVSNGKVVWKARLPAGGQATPMSYVSDKTGKQYVVVMAGGHGSLGTKMGDTLMAFALPDSVAPPTPAASK